MLTTLILSASGGAGRTTITKNFAVQAASQGYNVAISDFDPQQSLTKWVERRHASKKNINKSIEPKFEPYIINSNKSDRQYREWLDKLEHDGIDILFIDTPSYSNTIKHFEKYLDFINHILIPIRPEVSCLERLHDSINLARSRRIPFSILINMTTYNSKRQKEKVNFIESIIDKHFKHTCNLIGSISDSVIISDPNEHGLTANEYKPHSKPAIEMERAVDRFIKIIEKPLKKRHS